MDTGEVTLELKKFIERDYLDILLESHRTGENFLLIDFNKLASFNLEFAELLLDEPEDFLKCTNDAVKSFENTESFDKIQLRFHNLPDDRKLKLRDIRSENLDKLYVFFRFNTSWWTLGLSIFLLGVGWLICGWTALAFIRTKGTPVPFNPPPRLITTGLYSYIRNPMLLGLFIFLFGLGTLLGSLSLIFIFTPLFILINIVYIKAVEEKEMEKKFGPKYQEYKKRVPMFIPKLK